MRKMLLTVPVLMTAMLAACVSAVTEVPNTPLPTFSSPPATATETPLPTDTATPVPSATATAPITLKIMPLGDSITFGVPDPRYGGYRHLLGELLTHDGYLVDFVGSQQSGKGVIPDPDNEGHPGWKILDIKYGIDTYGWLETYRPDIILLHIGTNDINNNIEGYMHDSLGALLDDILTRLPETHVIVAQIIPYAWGLSRGHEFYNDIIPGIVQSKGPRVSIVDMQKILSLKDFADTYHPNAGGYDKMARAWEPAILTVINGSK